MMNHTSSESPAAPSLARITREKRKAANLTQKELANKIGLTQSVICAIECGKYQVASLARLSALGTFLGLDDSELAKLRTDEEAATTAACFNARCPTQRIYSAGMTAIFRPRLIQPGSIVGPFCVE